MFGLVGLVLGFTALVVLGVLALAFSLVVGLVTLPFRILGFGIKLVVGLLFLPFFLLLGLFGFGLGMLFLMARLLPLVLLIAGIVWLVRRGRRPNVANGARV